MALGNQEGSSGGSIWLEGNSIIVIGSLNASGGNGRYHPGGGGRIRLEYGSNMNYTGYIGLKGGKSSVYPGTLTFTNNTWPGDWNIKGTVGLLGGDYGEGEVVNILGNFNSGGIFLFMGIIARYVSRINDYINRIFCRSFSIGYSGELGAVFLFILAFVYFVRGLYHFFLRWF